MTIADRYQQDLERNQWHSDEAQLRAVHALETLRSELIVPVKKRSAWSRLSARLMPGYAAPAAAGPKGLYLWGGVGRGKTYLMDLFYAELGDIPRRRQHFHRFMLDVHAQLDTLNDVDDPLALVAKRISESARVICFDEFFVADIADAMILGRLFTQLFEFGVVLVATSNVPPDELYRGGLQRAQFLPAIEALKEHTQVLEVDAGEDYRLNVLKRADTYLFPHSTEAQKTLDRAFRQLAPDAGTKGALLELQGREIFTLRRADGIVWFTFAAICDGPRGAADYIEIARSFQTVLISNIPQLDQHADDQARRFITLIDEFYDRKVKLLVSAATALETLYTGKRLAFEFERTRSRLIEMQGVDYLAQAHIP